MDELVVGIDLGTSGVRALATDLTGHVLARAGQSLGTTRDASRVEQDPTEWWQAAVHALRLIVSQLGQETRRIRAVSIAATSGTVCLLDAQGAPLRPALLYPDSRSQAETERLNDLTTAWRARLDYRFHSSWGLPKLCWLARYAPAEVAEARYLAHAGDVLTGQLTGELGVSDVTQALKSGYDLLELRWPEWMADALGAAANKLPKIVASGSVIGPISPAAAAQTGLPREALVLAGMTDSCAAQIAAGAVRPGQWLSVLGTTLVFKGVSRERIRDAAGRVYNHRHPDGYWLPGAASNTGGEALAEWSSAILAAYDAAARELTPTGLVCYPLRAQGERFPFVRPSARGFLEGTPRSDHEHYAAALEGVAYVERLGYSVLHSLGADSESQLLTTGGGARSQVWNQIRADVLGRPLAVAAALGADFGAAVIAACRFYPSLSAATAAMTSIREIVTPRPDHAAAYETAYQQFVRRCRELGYLEAAA